MKIKEFKRKFYDTINYYVEERKIIAIPVIILIFYPIYLGLFKLVTYGFFLINIGQLEDSLKLDPPAVTCTVTNYEWNKGKKEKIISRVQVKNFKYDKENYLIIDLDKNISHEARRCGVLRY